MFTLVLLLEEIMCSVCKEFRLFGTIRLCAKHLWYTVIFSALEIMGTILKNISNFLFNRHLKCTRYANRIGNTVTINWKLKSNWQFYAINHIIFNQLEESVMTTKQY